MAIRWGAPKMVWGWIVAMLIAPATASNPVELERGPSAAAATSVDSVLSEDASVVARWVIGTEDNRGLPFAIVDKKRAQLFLFAASGRLLGESSVLLGLTVGDDSVADMASRTPASLMPAERTTPAGRFVSEPGHNAQGEDIVWFDYDASLAIHRLRPAPASQHRDERMNSARIEDKRISYGCIVVPVTFYDALVRPVLGRQRGVVYVLPETRPLVEMLRGDRLSQKGP